ncbi:hypothetical protein [Promicromonospora sp. NPDC019610]|uniref:hypothetical protein n=1 Tax=Promicromonospora sp. NPDC019610 TaxID=3364405 RepID=UPI0037AB27D9
MGSVWSVQVGGQAIPVWGKNYVPDELMLLFADEDRFVDAAKLAAWAGYENRTADAPEPDELPASWYRDLMGYSATAPTLRKRLALQGFSSDWVRRLSTAFFDDDEQRDLRTLGQGGTAAYPDGAAITAALSTRSGRAAGAGFYPDLREQPEAYFLYEQWELLREAFDDPRFALALSLCRTRAATEVRLDLTDLVLGGWLATDETLHREARTRMSASVAADGAVIVVTEGSSDAHRLRRSLEVAAPEVAHLFRFLDFDLRPPGGTDRVVSLTKGMAAAGIMNRIIAVLDNDTAGREAAAQLSNVGLPPQVVAVCLPEVPYVAEYPTLGPSGHGTENVNGRAASMEFMFGEDVLRNAVGGLAPVRWHAFNVKMSDYQGRLDTSDKIRVGQRIDAALSVDASDRVPNQVRAGCFRLARMLVDAADPRNRIPASEGSILTQMWRRDPFSDIHIKP